MLAVVGLVIPQSLMMANQWERAVVLRMGRLQAIKGPGVFWIVPILDRVATWLDQRIQTTEFNAEQALSKDTVPVNIDAVVFWQIHDPERAALEIADYRSGISRVAQTSLREMVGSSLLSTLLSDRKHGDEVLRDEIGRKIADWGISVLERRDPRHQRAARPAGRHEPPGPGRARAAGAGAAGPGRAGGGDQVRRGRGNLRPQPGGPATSRHEHYLRDDQGARRHHPDADVHGRCDESGRGAGPGRPGAAARRAAGDAATATGGRRERASEGTGRACASWTGSWPRSWRGFLLAVVVIETTNVADRRGRTSASAHAGSVGEVAMRRLVSHLPRPPDHERGPAVISAMLRRLGAPLLAALALAASCGGAALAQSAAGDWKGVLDVTPALHVRIAIHLKPKPGGGLDGVIDSPDQGVYGKPIVATAADGKLSFTDPAINAQYAATWDPAAHAWNGVWRQWGRDIPLVLTAGDYPPPATIAGLDGEWDGGLDMGTGLRLRLAFHIKTGPHGTLATIDSVDQGAYGGGVSAISRDGDHVMLRMNMINAVFDARLSDADQTLAGTFTQNGQGLRAGLKRLPPGAPSPWPRPSVANDAAAAPAGDWKIPTDAEIAALLAERIDNEHQGVGAVVGIVDGHGRRVVVYGKSDADNARPLDGDTEFEIGSITKVFTALMLADMAAKGEVKLDDPIAKYLPPGVTGPTKDGKAITLLDLATHTSGLPRMPSNFAPKDPANPYADYSQDQLWHVPLRLSADPRSRRAVGVLQPRLRPARRHCSRGAPGATTRRWSRRG